MVTRIVLAVAGCAEPGAAQLSGTPNRPTNPSMNCRRFMIQGPETMEYYPLHGRIPQSRLAGTPVRLLHDREGAPGSLLLRHPAQLRLGQAEAVSVQTNAALFAAADSGCEDL